MQGTFPCTAALKEIKSSIKFKQMVSYERSSILHTFHYSNGLSAYRHVMIGRRFIFLIVQSISFRWHMRRVIDHNSEIYAHCTRSDTVGVASAYDLCIYLLNRRGYPHMALMSSRIRRFGPRKVHSSENMACRSNINYSWKKTLFPSTSPTTFLENRTH